MRGWRAALLAVLAIIACCVAGCSSASAGGGHPTTVSSSTAPTGGAPTAKEFIVFFKPGDHRVEVAAIERRVRGTTGVTGCRFYDHEQSYRYAKHLLKGKSAFPSGLLSPSASPEIYLCRASGRSSAAVLSNRFRMLPGVFQVEAATS